ncbi:MAG TPA: protein-disulfide reductase DsbD domain-containing protein [Verrucomicrobiae bacterium]|nr:protein-disulfide reductase DsbD domain-containing protein [Verrucomicrobiae bacterium]
MKLHRLLWTTLLVVLFAGTAHGAATDTSLILGSQAARPGDTVMAGIRLRMKPGWHVYWRNPGGSGLPVSITWHLPNGFTAGEIQWPVPAKLPAEELTTYIYEDETVLLVPLKIALDAPFGQVELKANVSWLECKTQCVPGSGDVQAFLTVGDAAKPSPDATLIAEWQKKLPLKKPDLGARAFWEGPPNGDTRGIIFEWPAKGTVKDADFYPYSSDKSDVQWKNTFVPAEGGMLRLKKIVKKLEGNWPDNISGLLVQKLEDRTLAYEVNLPISETGIPPATSKSAPLSGAAARPPQRFSLVLLYAFLGGIILNVMPCVLPVIALKILGFVNQSKEHPRHVRKLGLLYAAGVLVSFLALAVLVIFVKQLGHAASWGMQFQNPQFLVLMTALVSLIALNLFGVFEINLGGSVMGTAGKLASKEGSAGAFLNGLLATILATPCTAPFLGPALGFAFTQPAGIIILVFLTVGLGLAAPYVILSWEPAWLKFLPKPGAWMEKFKVAMGFPMLATAIWLFTLTTPFFGEDGDLWLGMFLVLIGLGAWVWGQFVQRGRARRALAVGVSLGIFLIAYGYLLERQLDWRHPRMVAKGSLQNAPDGIDWQPWSPDALKEARAAGRPVLVDFTAKWCLICQLNKREALEIPKVRAKLKQIGAVALEENSYTKDPVVIAELNRYQRAGVPLVLIYPKDPNAAPEVLPELLTPNIVLSALDKAVAN